jgi:MFS family permease
MPRLFASLRQRDFRVFFIGQSISLLGTWMRSAALGWLAFQWTGSEFKLGLVAVVNSLPALFLAGWAGSLADRHSKLKMVKLTTWSALLASTMMALLLALRLDPGFPALLAMALWWGLAQAFEAPARQSMIRDLAGREAMGNAIAINSAAFNVARMVGPALGGLLLGSLGAAWCFGADALSFLAVLYSLAVIPETPPRLQKGDGSLGEVWAYLRQDRASLRVLLLLAVVSLFGWTYATQMAAYAKRHLGLDAHGFGLLLAINGAGACLGALWVAARAHKPRPLRQMAAGLALLTLGLLAAGQAQGLALAALALFIAGLGMLLFFATGNTTLQARVPDALRGRVMGLWITVFMGSAPIGTLPLGWAAEAWGSARAIQMSGLLCGLLCLGVWLLVPAKGQAPA